MPLRFNPVTATLELVSTTGGGGGSGNVTGISPTTVTAIARWEDTLGTIIANSLALVQDGGAIESNGFISNRTISTLVNVQSGQSWIAPSLTIAPGGVIVLNPDAELIIV